MSISAKHRSELAAYRQMSEIFSSETKNSKQANKPIIYTMRYFILSMIYIRLSKTN